ncbi:hypothetical protein FRC03_005961 [Tulasnella sp. 419]|nr:hypothetical protein FRC03_005961 [Tulasnella sp. 419]
MSDIERDLGSLSVGWGGDTSFWLNGSSNHNTMSSSNNKYTLFHSCGSGSTVPRALLRLYDVPHEVVEVDYEAACRRDRTKPHVDSLLNANPLGQFPTLLTPDGDALSEIAAIAIYLDEKHGKASTLSLASMTNSQRAAFYRWIVFIPANMYPLITIIDFPERFVDVPADASVEKEAVQQWIVDGCWKRMKEMWFILEDQLGKRSQELGKGPFILGTEHPNALDLFLAICAHWSPPPRPDWLKENCPVMAESVRKTVNASSVTKDVFREQERTTFIE